MGRGRAKAKQTKVARELKYSAPSMDLSRLQRDLKADDPLRTQSIASLGDREDTEDADDDGDPYDSYAEEDDEDSAAS